MDDPLTVTLNLSRGDGPITGVLENDGTSHDFSGWIELVALIEAQRDGHEDGEREERK